MVKPWLESARRGREPLGIPGVTASGFLRIVTQRRIFREPISTSMAVDFIERLLRSRAPQIVTPTDCHLGILSRCRGLRLKGSDILDAYLVALAVEREATFATGDRGFRRFGDSRVLRPGES